MTELFTVQSLVEQHLAGQREKREIKSWHASGLGSCLTSRYLERTGVPADTEFDARTLRIFSVGNHFEDWLCDIVAQQEGVKSERQVRIDWPEFNFSGKADQVFSEPEPMVYEYKTMHSRAFWHMQKEDMKGKINHRMQLWSYLERLGVENGRLVYFSKDDLTIAEYEVSRGDTMLRDLVHDELTILNAAWEAKLPPSPAVWEGGEWRRQKTDDWQTKYSRWSNQIFEQEKYLPLSGLKLNYPIKQ